MTAIVGCCGWAEAQPRYVQHFPAIEIQTTFYQPPALDVARRWKALAPQPFIFSIKAWQLITHTCTSPTYRRLKEGISEEERESYGSFRPTEQVMLAWERTRDIARVLEARVVVFQCPKSFLPTQQNLRNIASFFAGIDCEGRLLAWEPRGDEWKPDIVRGVCADSGLVHCVDPFQTEAVYGDALYWRLHGKAGYRYRYTEEDLDQLALMLRAKNGLPGPKYVMFNNIYSKDDAARFLAR